MVVYDCACESAYQQLSIVIKDIYLHETRQISHIHISVTQMNIIHRIHMTYL